MVDGVSTLESWGAKRHCAVNPQTVDCALTGKGSDRPTEKSGGR